MEIYMNWLVDILGSATVATALIGGVVYLSREWLTARLIKSISHEYDKDLRRLENDLRKQTDTELAKLNANLSKELELARLKLGPYSSRQFTAYNDLWLILLKLKESMRKLYGFGNEAGLQAFAEQLIQASELLDANALLIAPKEYNELKDILDEFLNFRMDKETLLQLFKDKQTGNPVSKEEFNLLLGQTQNTRGKLEHKIDDLRHIMRKQIAAEE